MKKFGSEILLASMKNHRGLDWQIEDQYMSTWKRVPWTTKVLLGVLIGLGVIFLILWFARDGFIPGGDNHASKDKGEMDSSAVTSGLIDGEALPTITIPSGIPWLSALSSSPIFTGPGDTFPRLGLLESGDGAEVVGISQDSNWWAIKVPYFESGWGWVSADQVIANNTEGILVLSSEDGFIPNQTASNDIPSLTALANVNVRSGPGLEFIKIGLLESGQTAEIVGRDPEGFWWAIKLTSVEGGQGWVSRDYVVARNESDVQVIGSSVVNNGNIPTPETGAPSLTTIFVVNIRSGPGIGFSIIGKLAPDQKAEVIGKSQDGLWWAIKLPVGDNGRGWISIQYVTVENTENVPVLK